MPDYEAFMLPLLQALDADPTPIETAADRVADRLGLSPADRARRAPWAHEPMLIARTRVAAESLAAARLVVRSGDQLALAPRGIALLSENPPSMSREALRRYPEFEAYLQAHLARQGA